MWIESEKFWRVSFTQGDCNFRQVSLEPNNYNQMNDKQWLEQAFYEILNNTIYKAAVYWILAKYIAKSTVLLTLEEVFQNGCCEFNWIGKLKQDQYTTQYQVSRRQIALSKCLQAYNSWLTL